MDFERLKKIIKKNNIIIIKKTPQSALTCVADGIRVDVSHSSRGL